MTKSLIAVLITLTMLSSVAFGAKPDAERHARRVFEKAEAHFKAGLFAEALAEYQDGYEHMPLPGFLINIAQCQRRLGDLERAHATYRKFVLVAPDSPYVPEVEKLIAELDKLLDVHEQAAPTPESKASEADSQTVSSAQVVSNPFTPSPSGPSGNPLVEQSIPASETVHITSRWWFWTGLGAVAILGGVAAIYALTPAGSNTVHNGSLATLRR